MNKPLRLFLVRHVSALLLGFTIVACSPAQEEVGPSPDEDLAAVSEARNAILAALHNDDLSGIMASLGDAHQTMAPGAPTVPDSEALREWHRNRIDLFSLQSDHTTEEMILAGDLAIEKWSGQSRLTSKAEGEVVEDSIKGLWIWQRQVDGSWKLMWSIWNSDLPVGFDWQVGEGS